MEAENLEALQTAIAPLEGMEAYQPLQGVDKLLYEAARMGWVTESVYPVATERCPNPYFYGCSLTRNSSFDADFAKMRAVLEILSSYKFRWTELIQLAMQLIPFVFERLLHYASEEHVDLDVVKVASAVWFLTAAQGKGIIKWDQLQDE